METMQSWWERLNDSKSVWRHSGDIRAPHVELRSGLHSDIFIDTLQYLSVVRNLNPAAHALAQKIRSKIPNMFIDWVFGSPMAGIPLATEVAFYIGAHRTAFTEKAEDKKLICRFELKDLTQILLVEEMTSTGETPQRVIDAIRQKNPRVVILPFIGAFLTRRTDPPGLQNVKVVSLIDLEELRVRFHEWTAIECPLCVQGSLAIKNCKRAWADLLQTMENPLHKIPNI